MTRLTFAPLRGHELPIDMVMLVIDATDRRAAGVALPPVWRWIVNHKGSSTASGVSTGLSAAQRDMAAAIADIATRPETYASKHDLTLCAEPLCVHSAARYLHLKDTQTIRGFCLEHAKRTGRYGADDEAANYFDVTDDAIRAMSSGASELPEPTSEYERAAREVAQRAQGGGHVGPIT